MNSEWIKPIQAWEGVVTEINDDEFIATLYDRTNPGNQEEQAEFTFDDLSWHEDKELVVLGAIFDVSVGYETKMTGHRQKVCRLYFRRNL